MIEIKQIIEPVCRLYSPDDTLVGKIISGVQLCDVRCQIKKESVEGYYIIWNNGNQDFRLNINKNGGIDYWPDGFYDQLDKYLLILTDWEL